MKKILIIGSKGMAGHVIRQVLISSKQFLVIDIARDNAFFEPTFLLDVSKLEDLQNILKTVKPDVVINCIGILNDEAEKNPDRSIFINSFLPHFLAKNCPRLIHISTDCVFSGKKGSYTEEDVKDGVGFYAQSKALGEVLYQPHVTLRTSIIGPELKDNGIGLLHWFLKQSGSVKGYTKAYWSGITTLQLAKCIIWVINNPQIMGIIHLTNNSKISKLNLLQIFSTEMEKQLPGIIPFDGYESDKSIINTRNDIDIQIPSYKTMIRELFAFMKDHKSILYRQYNITE